jgi:hypothetical protein
VLYNLNRRHAVAQLVEALPYKAEDRFSIPDEVIDFPLMSSFQPYCDPGFGSASNRNEYQKYFLG